MFASIVLQLEPAGRTDFTGDHLHGWFMGQIGRHDPALAERLHAPARGKPFTLWAGPRFGLEGEGVVREDSDRVHWLRVTSLDAALTRALASMVASPRVASIPLGGATFTASRVFADGKEHPWSGVARHEELWRRWMTGAPPRGRVRLRFLSPTAFARGRHSTTLFPLASLVVGSLLTTWKRNVPETIGDEAAAALLECVREEAHDVRSVPPLPFDGYHLKGFVGECEYSCGSKASDQSRRLLHLLADFSFFAGVGLKRTMGMGQVVGESV